MRVFPFADRDLARRLERAEGQGCERFADARARVFPDRGACSIRVAGAFVVFDGRSSPITQTFGLGMERPVTAGDLDTIEAFFRERGAAALHEVSPLADAGLTTLLNERGYEPFEFTSVLYRPIAAGIDVTPNPAIRIRMMERDEEDLWASTAAAGWREFAGLEEFMLEIGRVNSRVTGATLFFAELDGQPIATAALNIVEGVAHLAGASTIPEGRRRGAQQALLAHRLRFAASRSCDLALMGAQPGSGSQRNAERHGFRVAYTRTKWRLPA
jgi:GNAT superfamily N-acetyltransferase